MTLGGVGARQADNKTVAVDADDIGGVVTGLAGRSRRVRHRGDDQPANASDQERGHRRSGRYLIPDLPRATYDVWVRGYGLIDSQKVKATPGKALPLTAVAAPSPRVAAGKHPAQYWLSLLQVPPVSDFRSTDPTGISPNIKSQGEWIRNIVNTDGCTGCHQMGGKATREIPEGSVNSRTRRRHGIAAFNPDRPAAA